MARLAVNPTRMELRRLKTRLKTAVRGHKLLKDKSDEMIRQFMSYAKQNKALREEVEDDLRDALKSFMLAGALMGEESIEQTFALPSYILNVTTGTKSVMGIDVLVDGQRRGRKHALCALLGFCGYGRGDDKAYCGYRKAFATRRD